MAITPVPDLPVLSSAPSSSDMANFDARADAFLPGLKPWGDIVKAIGDATKANAISANTDAGIALAAQAGAQAAAAQAAAGSGSTKWAAGNYNDGATVWSPIDYMGYRKRGTGASATDPSADATGWAPLTPKVAPTAVMSAGFNAVAGGWYPVDTSAGGFTIPFPANPSNGSQITLYDATRTWGANPAVVNPQGKKVAGLAEPYTCVTKGRTFTFTYIAALGDWSIQ